MPVDKEAELARVTNLRGFRYGLHDFLAEVDPDFLKAVNDTVETQYINTQILDRKTKEISIIVACISQVDTASHLQIHMHAAVQAGATGEEILAVINWWETGSATWPESEPWKPGASTSGQTCQRSIE